MGLCVGSIKATDEMRRWSDLRNWKARCVHSAFERNERPPSSSLPPLHLLFPLPPQHPRTPAGYVMSAAPPVPPSVLPDVHVLHLGP